MIEKIIHMTWKTKDLPEHYQANVDKWQELHPDYEIMIYDDTEINKFVEDNYPEFYVDYTHFPLHIMRVDFVRYALLHKYGGIYADMDTFPVNSFESLLDTDKIILASEAPEHCQALGLESMVCNAIMLSPSNLDFWYKFMTFIVKQTTRKVLQKTGPIALTNFINEYGAQDIKIIQSCMFYPMLNDRFHRGVDFEYKGQQLTNISESCQNEEIYAVHQWDNTWSDGEFTYAIVTFSIIGFILLILFILFFIIKRKHR